MFFSSSSVCTGSPTNTKLNTIEVYKGKKPHPKWEKIHTNYKFKSPSNTERLDEGKQTKQCDCCFVDVIVPRLMGKGRNTN